MVSFNVGVFFWVFLLMFVFCFFGRCLFIVFVVFKYGLAVCSVVFLMLPVFVWGCFSAWVFLGFLPPNGGRTWFCSCRRPGMMGGWIAVRAGVGFSLEKRPRKNNKEEKHRFS